MRPDPPHDPSVESVEELSDVGSLVILAPPPQERVELLDQLLGLPGHLPPGALSYLVHETTDRLLPRGRVQRTRTSLATDLALGQIKRLPALDLVTQEFETVLNVDDPRLLRVQLHAQLFQDSEGRVDGGSCLGCRFAGNHPVVGIPRELISLVAHLPIKWRQKDVAEQEGEYCLNAKDNVGRVGASAAAKLGEADGASRSDRNCRWGCGSNDGS